MTRTRLLLLTALAAALAARAAPAAAEFCVTCTGPDAAYRCAFEGETAATPQAGLQLLCISTLARDGGHQSCTIDRKRTPPCSGETKLMPMPAVHDGAGEAPAAGPDGPDGAQAPPDAPPNTPAEAPAGTIVTTPPPEQAAGTGANRKGNRQPENPAAKPQWDDISGTGETEGKPTDETANQGNGNVPEPLEKAGEAVQGAAKSAGTVLENAGTAVGSAAKKTWKCLTTLFGEC